MIMFKAYLCVYTLLLIWNSHSAPPYLLICFFGGFLSSRTRKEIGADAAHVDLRSRCRYFYELGLKIAPLLVSFSLQFSLPVLWEFC